MFEQLETTAKRYDELNRLLSDPAVLADSSLLRAHAKEEAELRPVVEAYQKYGEAQRELEDNQAMLREGGLEDDFVELIETENAALQERIEALEQELRIALLPQDPNDARGAVIEIRAGTGGDEAALFAADLFRMYSRYVEAQRWRMEILSASGTETGGFKEVIASIEGPNVYSKMKYESGTHRVQRVPATETQGRIHTSAATVAILPEAEDVDVDIDPTDLRIDVYRSSGPGGQSVNTTDSAVRITYEPKDRKDLHIVVTCQDEKSQHKNRDKAMKVLRARVLDILQSEQQAERAKQRGDMVGSGDRSGRIRTYNFPQGRITDHRINLTLYKLDQVLQGALDELVEALSLADQAAKLQAVGG